MSAAVMPATNPPVTASVLFIFIPLLTPHYTSFQGKINGGTMLNDEFMIFGAHELHNPAAFKKASRLVVALLARDKPFDRLRRLSRLNGRHCCMIKIWVIECFHYEG